MAGIQGIPYAGPVAFSLADCKDDLIDLPQDAVRYLRNAKPGIDGVRSELEQSVPVHGDAAGVTTSMHDQFVADTQLIDKLRAHELVLAKALEVVQETLAQKEHDRENTLSHIADRVKSTVQRTGNVSIMAPFQKTLDYNSQYAVKAAETRRKNGKSKAGTTSVP